MSFQSFFPVKNPQRGCEIWEAEDPHRALQAGSWKPTGLDAGKSPWQAGKRSDPGPGQEMPSEQKPAHFHHPPWAPAASRIGPQGHSLHMAGNTGTEPASTRTIQQPHTSQWHSKNASTRERILNKVSKQVEQREPKGKRHPPASPQDILHKNLTSPTGTSTGTGCPATTLPGKPHTGTLVCPRFPIPLHLPCPHKRRGRAGQGTWPGCQTHSNTPIKLTQLNEEK